MREAGIPQVLTWRWAPCAALAVGALGFAGVAMLAIPDHIGAITTSSDAAPASMGASFARTQTPSTGSDWASPERNERESLAAMAPAASRLGASAAAGGFPKRGFSPPLERVEAPPAPPPAVPPSPPPAPPQPVAVPAPQPPPEAPPQNVPPPPEAPAVAAAPAEALPAPGPPPQ
jgi:hypothetical protein